MKKAILIIALFSLSINVSAQLTTEKGIILRGDDNTGGSPYILLSFNGTRYFGMQYWNSGLNFYRPGKPNSGDGTFFIDYNTGNIGIGTFTPKTWKLAVNGKIRAKEINVESGWSDFVFEKDYDLPSLKEVENHIKEKGHLKDIPSAKEVEKNGVFLGEMDAKLLQKIEELMLYTIEQEKKIESLEKQNIRIEKLEKENKNLKLLTDRLTKIESLLERKN